ncbi:MAG: T9SS type A sorting domain-containing protein [Lentimicrobium sp.]|nr:T9SS type A sorting domain-containing protein [Lentimicrobium sp.]
MTKYFGILAFLFLVLSASSQTQISWRHYTPGNTGIMGDYSDALWLAPDNNPYIAAYVPGWEEGGFSKYNFTSNTWENFSNINYPAIGSIYDVGSARISEITEDESGVLWMATWRGLLSFDPAEGGSSITLLDAENSLHPGGRTINLEVAPDGTIWAAVLSVVWGDGGLIRYNPANNQMQYWGYGTTANNWPSLTSFCENVAIQSKANGGYKVWIDAAGWNEMIQFDSDTQLFTKLPQNGNPGEVVALPGKDCVDDAGNLWAFRMTEPGQPFSLDYLTPAGAWVTPAQNPVSSDTWAFRAFGDGEALLTGLSSEIFHFNGSQWVSKGIWRQGAYTSDMIMDSEGNIWVNGIEGAARRDAVTGNWQRFRITNSSQIDYWVDDISIDQDGNVWLTGNAGPGTGGFQKFDGQSWTGFNEFNYGMGYSFPFPTDNVEAIFCRPSNGNVVLNPMFNFLHQWDGSSYSSLNYGYDRSAGLTEDSQGRLWSLGEYYHLEYYSDNTANWTSVEFLGWGYSIHPDPLLPGTILACSNYQVLRTNGIQQFSRVVDDFPELDPQSDAFSAAVTDLNGNIWVGSGKGLFKINPNTGNYNFYSPSNSEIPGELITPLAVSPDGKIWFANFQSEQYPESGLCWFDGQNFGIYPVSDQTVPHGQIKDIEVKPIPGGYELWISCLSRGIAVMSATSSTADVNYEIKKPGNWQINAYPNPADNMLNIELLPDEADEMKLEICNVFGQKIMSWSLYGTTDDLIKVVWDLTNQHGNKVEPGTYILNLSGTSGFATSKVVVYP